MQLEHHGKRYRTIRASDLDRDGMGSELESDGRVVAEVFYSDVSGGFTVSLFEQGLPLLVVEQFIAEARVALRPVRGTSNHE